MVRAGIEVSFAEVGTRGTVAHLVRRCRRSEGGTTAAGGSTAAAVAAAASVGGLDWIEDAVHNEEYSELNLLKPPGNDTQNE